MRLARPASLVVAALLGAGVLAGCGGGNGYSASVEGAFVVACNPDHDATRQEACRCAYERYSAAHSYEDFRVVDRSLQADPDKVPKDLPEDLVRFMTACAIEASEASASSSSTASSSSSVSPSVPRP